MDVESLQSSGRRRGSCLDVFLVVSVIFLFVALAVVGVCGAMFVMKLQTKLETPQVEVSRLTGDTADSVYKMQNFVYLEPKSSALQTSTMTWASVLYGTGDSIGSNYIFDPIQNSLMPKRQGTYFMYINLNLTCTYNCSPGILSVKVGDKLTCEVELPEVANSIPVSKKCWTVSRLEKEGLITDMILPTAGLENWRLELNSSGFGMFLVD